MAETGGPHSTKGAWLVVIVIIVAFIAGVLALILHSIPLWIVFGVLLVAGGIGGLVTGIMEQAH